LTEETQKDHLYSQINIKIKHLAVLRHDVFVIIRNDIKKSFYRMNTYTKLLGTQQYSSSIYCLFKQYFHLK